MSKPTKPGNSERGWNDPPVFLYDSTTALDNTVVVPKRHLLNKRVPFPSQPGSAVSVPASGTGLVTDGKVPLSVPPPAANIQLLPPSGTTEPPLFTAPLIVPSMDSTASLAKNPVSGITVAAKVPAGSDPDLEIPDFESDDQLYHYTTSRLNRAVKDCQAASVEARITDEIHKKVEVFSDMWKNGKISYPVKCTMAKLATAIHRRKCSAAHELHLVLMIDHVSEVSRWLIGIKRLIQEVESVAQPTSPSAICSDQSFVITEPVGQINLQSHLDGSANLFASEGAENSTHAVRLVENNGGVDCADKAAMGGLENSADGTRLKEADNSSPDLVNKTLSATLENNAVPLTDGTSYNNIDTTATTVDYPDEMIDSVLRVNEEIGTNALSLVGTQTLSDEHTINCNHILAAAPLPSGEYNVNTGFNLSHEIGVTAEHALNKNISVGQNVTSQDSVPNVTTSVSLLNVDAPVLTTGIQLSGASDVTSFSLVAQSGANVGPAVQQASESRVMNNSELLRPSEVNSCETTTDGSNLS